MNDGDLPEGWAQGALAELFDVNPRKPSADALSPMKPVSFVPMGAVDAASGTVTQREERPFSSVRKGYTAFAEGDVILAKITPCFENGKIAIARGLCSGLGFGSSEFHVFRPRGAVLSEYFFHFLRQEKFREDAADHMTSTAGQARLPADYVKGVRLPVPPLAEQHRVVNKVEAFLAHVNAARKRLAKLPAILDSFRRSVLADACAGKLTEDWREEHPRARPPALPRIAEQQTRKRRRGANLSADDELFVDEDMPELPESWRYVRADRLVEPGTIITYGIVLPGPEVPGGVPYVRQQDVDGGTVRVEQLRHTSPEIAARHKASSLREGDVLLCVIRNLRVAVVPKGLDGANLTQGTVRLRPNRSVVLGAYLAAYLASPQAQGWMKRRYFGMDMPRINVEDARAVPVALPDLDEQQETVRRVERLFALAAATEERLTAATARANILAQAILGRAFRGELVPTEAELAREEGRNYEPAAMLLERIREEGRQTASKQTATAKRSQRKAGAVISRHSNLGSLRRGRHLLSVRNDEAKAE